MSNEITQINLLPKQLVEETQRALERLTFEDLKKYFITCKPEILKTVTDEEFVLWLNLCKANSLNPWNKEIYAIKYAGSPLQATVSYFVYLKRADLHPEYDGYKSGLIMQNNIVKGAWCEVYRKDRKYPTRVEVLMEYYNTGKSMWVKMPKQMIEKVAIKQAHEKCFPNNCANIMTVEESAMRLIEDESNVISASYEVKPEIFENKNKADSKLRIKLFKEYDKHGVDSDLLKEYLKSIGISSTGKLTVDLCDSLLKNVENISKTILQSNEPNEKPLTGKEESQQDLGV